MSESNRPSWYLRKAEKLDVQGLSQTGRALYKSLDEFGTTFERRSALRSALVLNTPWISLLNFPPYPYSDLPTYQINETAGEILRGILLKKIELQAEMSGFDEANRIFEEGFSEMYRELVIEQGENSINGKNREKFLTQMAFIRIEFMAKTEEGSVS